MIRRWEQSRLTPLAGILERARSAQSIGVIGTGLTAVDVVRALLVDGYRGRITIASRRGLLPAVRSHYGVVPEILTRERLLELEGLRIRQLLEFIADEARHHDVSLEVPLRLLRGESLPVSVDCDADRPGPDWRALFTAICDEAMPEVWNLMDNESKRVFLRWLHPFFQSWCNPMPQETAALLARAMRADQLVVRRGLVLGREGQLEFADGGRVRCDMIVAAHRGGEEGIADVKTPLVQSLLDRGLARRARFGGLDVRFGSWRLIGIDGVDRPIFAIGSLAQSARYYVNALDSIIRTIPEAVSSALAASADVVESTPSSSQGVTAK